MFDILDWHQALKTAAYEVQALNAAFGDNPIYANPDAIQWIEATKDTAAH